MDLGHESFLGIWLAVPVLQSILCNVFFKLSFTYFIAQIDIDIYQRCPGETIHNLFILMFVLSPLGTFGKQCFTAGKVSMSQSLNHSIDPSSHAGLTQAERSAQIKQAIDK